MSATTLMAQTGTAQYDNTLYIDDMEVPLNSEVTLSVKMKNSVEAEGFAFDLFLPYGMSVVTDDDGNPMASLSEERIKAVTSIMFGAAMLTAYQNNVLRVIAASTNGSAISPGEGEVCTVRVRIPAGYFEGQYTLRLQNISISDTEACSHDVALMTSSITVSDFNLGDANGDGKVNVADLVAISHYVIGQAPADFSFKGADANQDLKVNVADFIAVAHLIGEDPTQSQGGFPRMPPASQQQLTGK